MPRSAPTPSSSATFPPVPPSWGCRRAPMPAPETPGAVMIPEPRENPVHPMARFFEGQRERLRERSAARGERPPNRSAVITMVHDEAVFLPIWLRYYSRFFAPGDIYVLDNETSDGSTAAGGFVRIPVAHDRVDHTWMV